MCMRISGSNIVDSYWLPTQDFITFENLSMEVELEKVLEKRYQIREDISIQGNSVDFTLERLTSYHIMEEWWKSFPNILKPFIKLSFPLIQTIAISFKCPQIHLRYTDSVSIANDQQILTF